MRHGPGQFRSLKRRENLKRRRFTLPKGAHRTTLRISLFEALDFGEFGAGVFGVDADVADLFAADGEGLHDGGAVGGDVGEGEGGGEEFETDDGDVAEGAASRQEILRTPSFRRSPKEAFPNSFLWNARSLPIVSTR